MGVRTTSKLKFQAPMQSPWSHCTLLMKPKFKDKIIKTTTELGLPSEHWFHVVTCLSMKPVLLLAILSASSSGFCLPLTSYKPSIFISDTSGCGQVPQGLTLPLPLASTQLSLRGHCEGTARRDCLFPLVRAHCGCSWEPGPKERRMFSLPMCLQLLLPVLVKRSPRVKNDNLCTLLITLPFHGKMVVTFPSWQQQNPPSDLAGSDLEV